LSVNPTGKRKLQPSRVRIEGEKKKKKKKELTRGRRKKDDSRGFNPRGGSQILTLGVQESRSAENSAL
jgi:hypothetical protein